MEIDKDYEGINLRFYKNDFSSWTKQDEIEYNNNEIRYKERYHFFQNTFDYLSANFVAGDYFEFGVHKARTFRIALSEAKKKNMNNMNFFAFDSFEGLPKPTDIDKLKNWDKGALSTSLDFFNALITEHNIYTKQVHTIKGFYQDSLTEKLRDNSCNISVYTRN